MSKSSIIKNSVDNLLVFGGILLLTFLFATIVRRILKNKLQKKLQEHESDLTSFKFIRDLITFTIYLVGIGWALLTLPISKTYAHTLFASAGASTLIVGFASQQVLSNLMSGIFIVIKRPFKVNDIIEISGNIGKVIELNIHETILETIDEPKKTIIIPNSLISNSIIINHNKK